MKKMHMKPSPRHIEAMANEVVRVANGEKKMPPAKKPTSYRMTRM